MIAGFSGACYELHFSPLAESALLLRIGDGEIIDPAVIDTVTALTHKLDAAPPPGTIDIVPAYATILIAFDPGVTDGEAVESYIRAVAAAGITERPDDARLVIIPVAYGGEHGLDLATTASELGLTPDELIARHASAEYRVACMGFSPGWAYLIGLDPRLAVPRLKTPRTHIPAGTVAIGGAQTGIYPLESPGGWRLIGRTPLSMFDPERDEPFFLQQGDRVRFAPIDTASYTALRAKSQMVGAR